VAVLTENDAAPLHCFLCGQAVERPLRAGGHVFCCHGCRGLWAVLGDAGVAQLRAGPQAIPWDVVRGGGGAAGQGPEGPAAMAVPPAAGGEAPGVRTASLALSGLWCVSCGALIEHVVQRKPGVLGVRVDYAASRAEVAFDPGRTGLAEIAATVQALGYGTEEGAEERSEGDLLRRLGWAVLLSALVMMFSVPVWSGYLPQLPPGLRDALILGLWLGATPVVFWAGGPLLRGAWQSLRHGAPTMDLLVALGTLAAYAYSVAAALRGGPYLYFDTGCMIMTFILLARSLEVAARSEASRLLQLLSSLAARDAVVLRDGEERAIPVAEVAVGDVLVVRPGQRVPLDGRVQEGTSAVDESSLTGEPLPVEKGPGAPVYAGSLNGYGRLYVRTTHSAEASVLGQTVAAMRAAQARRGPWQALADRLVRIFVPAVLAVACATFLGWWRLGGLPVGPSLLRAIAVLVIACPCALAVATPLAVLAGAQRLGRAGVLLRTGDALERAAAVDTVLLDKTGTLTTGQMRLVGLEPDDPEALALAAAVEAASEHPIGAAVVAAAQARGILWSAVDSFRAQPGRGVKGVVGGRAVWVGAPPRPGDPEAPAGWTPQWAARAHARESAGQTVLAVEVDGRVRALLGLSDTPRAEAAAAVARLQEAGLEVGLVTGDGEGAGAAAAQATGIGRHWARQRPADKAAVVQALQAQGRRVAFVGDGVNDAVALVQADLGVALAAGADVAVEAGQLTLVRPDLAALPAIVRGARQAVGLIRQNLAWALVYNLAAVPVAALGGASPVLAAAAMVCSSALVLGNTLRLLGNAPWRMARGALVVAAAGALLGVVAWRGV
jgi:Cu2+-exporting ATPase